jgi:hypothetical protein
MAIFRFLVETLLSFKESSYFPDADSSKKISVADKPNNMTRW